jgi:carbohydrate-selective porin OprB
MSGFETYSIQSWLIDCLTRHPPAVRESVPKKRASSPSALTRVMSSLTACAALSSVSVATAAVSAAPRMGGDHPTSLTDQNIVVDLPTAYWSRAIAEVRSWRVVEEPEVTDPPLLF